MTNLQDYLTTRQAAEVLGVTAERVRQFIKQGRLPRKQVGGPGTEAPGGRPCYLVHIKDLEKLKNRPWGRPRTRKLAAG